MSPPEDNPFPQVVERWEQVIEDMHVTAEEYRADGLNTVELHPGDVMTLTYDTTTDSELGARHGIDVLVPGDEYADLADAVEGHTLDHYEVLRAVDNHTVFLLIVFESADGRLAVFVPAYYELADVSDLRSEDTVHTYVRSLSADGIVTFSHDNPEPLFPDKEELSTGEGDAGE